jgi:hypothetical protein
VHHEFSKEELKDALSAFYNALHSPNVKIMATLSDLYQWCEDMAGRLADPTVKAERLEPDDAKKLDAMVHSLTEPLFKITAVRSMDSLHALAKPAEPNEGSKQ